MAQTSRPKVPILRVVAGRTRLRRAPSASSIFDRARHSATPMRRLRWVSFGATSATVTSMGLIIGLGAAAAEKATIVSGLLIVALADNLTDSLSLHIYQEAERLNDRAAFRATLTNFGTRVLVALTFVGTVLAFPADVSNLLGRCS